MVSTDRLLAFAAMSFLLIVVPGPSVLFVIGRALAQGRRAALATVAGNTLGSSALVVAVALGVGAVVERSVVVFTALKLAGAAYLVYLGVRAVRQRAVPVAAEALPSSCASDGPLRGGLRRTLWEGFAVGVANPKTIVFFAAVLPQFVDRGQGYAAVQMMLLGFVFNVIAVLCDSVWGLAAAAARSWFAHSPKRLSLIGGAGGFAMIGLGVTVAVTGRKE
ncbi:LysE family translocator [Streptomyces albus]|uniref:LysE family translocator n=1 Tax=Streptomyces albus TaxID=1888 RepID=UPI0004C65D03|nr:LysE family translocator [Streptomyces albus]